MAFIAQKMQTFSSITLVLNELNRMLEHCSVFNTIFPIKGFHSILINISNHTAEVTTPETVRILVSSLLFSLIIHKSVNWFTLSLMFLTCRMIFWISVCIPSNWDIFGEAQGIPRQQGIYYWILGIEFWSI